MSVIKRLSTKWAMKRKSSKYIASPRGSHPRQESVPLVVVLRDLIGLAENGKEARMLIKTGKIMVDGKVCKDYRRGIGLLDVVHVPDINKTYRMIIKQGPKIIEVSSTESNLKLCRIVDKHVVRGGKIQLNLHDGRNMLLDNNDYTTNDSLLITLPDQKVKDHLKFEEGCLVMTNRGDIVKVGKIERGLNKRLWLDNGKEIPFKGFIVVGKDKSVLTVNVNE